MSQAADRNLLFGILAVQMDFISRDALISGMSAWVLDKKKSLGEILLQQKALPADAHALLDALVQKHMALHGNDAEKSLAAISSAGAVRKELEKITDVDVQASLVHVAGPRPGRPTHEADPYATSAAASISSGDSLRFRVLRPHAKGGLGAVFVAHDGELNREVALKEIQDRHADDAESRSRFLLEAEITGGLEHPGIVPVYGLGTYADGRPYYAMRFIRGDNLKDAIDRFHGKDGVAPAYHAGERALELRGLLGRFIDVCNAIAYAHSRGVLHRDLKPGNIMLGKYGETLVVDWGLAKPVGETASRTEIDVGEGSLSPRSLGSTSQTMMGSAVGTPQYMSPEQAAGKLDEMGPASDVYSLGATLFYLLTGKPPFEDSDVGEVLQKAQKGQLRRPRLLNPQVPAALEAICLKAMALKPADRYTSPRALATDIEHWLADEPVSAWTEPWTVRLRRWIDRHRVLVTSVASAVLVAVIGLSLATVLLTAAHDRERAARTDAENERAEALKQRAEAVKQKEKAVEAKQYAESQEAEAREQRAEAVKQKEKAVEAKLYAESKEAEAREQRAEALMQKAEAVKQKEKAVEARLYAESQEAEARKQRAEAVAQKAEADKQRARAEVNFRLARNAVDRYHTEVSEDMLLNQPGMETLRKKLLEAAREFYDKFTRERADDPSVRDDYGMALYRLAQITDDVSSEKDAIALHEKAVKVFEDLNRSKPAPQIAAKLAASLHHLGRLYRKMDRNESSAKSYRDALAIWQKLIERDPQEEYQAGLARTQLGLGNLSQLMRDLDSAQKFYKESLAGWQKLADAHPTKPLYQRERAQTSNNLGMVYRALAGKQQDAQQAFLTAAGIQKRLVEDNPVIAQYKNDLARTQYNLGDLFLAINHAGAEGHYKEAAGLWEGLVDRHPAHTEYQVLLADVLAALARLHRKAADFPRAEELSTKSLKIRLKLVRERPDAADYQENLAKGYFTLAEVRRSAGAAAKAQEAYQQALPILENLSGKYPATPRFRSELARVHGGLGLLFERDPEKAAAALSKALPIWEKLVKEYPREQEYARELFATALTLGKVARAGKKLSDALAWNTRALDALQPKEGPPSPFTKTLLVPLHSKRAELLTELGRPADALPDWDRALELLPPSGAASYRVAQAYGLAAASVAKDESRVEQQRLELSEEYANRAMKLLAAAQTAGHFKTPANLQKLRTDPELNSLRGRADFKQLLSELTP